MLVVWWLSTFFYLSKTVALAVPNIIDSAILPSKLISVLPSCGQRCVASSIAFAWPSDCCGSTTNLPCLCTTKSKTGFTLGEIIVQCLASACSASVDNGNKTLLQQQYNICADQPGDLPNTHPTLTATTPQTARITSEPSIIKNSFLTSTLAGVQSTEVISSASKTSSTAIFSSPTISPTISSSSVVSTSAVVQSSSTRESTASLTSTTHWITTSSTSRTSSIRSTATSSEPVPSRASISVSNSRRPLKGVEIAAITIGSLVVVSILFSMIMICLRQRQKGRRSGGDTSGFITLPSPSSTVGASRIGRAGLGNVPERPNRPSTGPGTRTVLTAPMKKVQHSSHLPSVNPDEIGVAISLDSKSLPQTPQNSSGSPSRSNSRLLPDKPVYKPVSPVTPRPFSDVTEFEDVIGMYNRSSSDTSVDWATAYYTSPFNPDEHLRGFQYAREMGALPAISRPTPVTNPQGWDSSGPKRLRTGENPIRIGNERRRESIVQGFPRPPRGIWPRQPETSHNIPHTPTPRPTKPFHEPPEENVSPISPSNLQYPTIPRSLSTTPTQVNSNSSPTRPSLPPRNDTYARNEDLVIATTQALEEITGSSKLLAEQAERDARLRQLHLRDEVERARQGIEIMRQRAATAAARIQRAQGMGLPSGPRPLGHRTVGLEQGGVLRSRPQ